MARFRTDLPDLAEDVGDRVRVDGLDTLSDAWYVLRRARFAWRRSDGRWQDQKRESYDRGNGVAILPYDPHRGTVILVRQFRWPAFENGWRHPMLEVPAGLLEGDDPVTTIVKEAEEEAGLILDPERVERTHHLFMSPGAVTERLHLFVAPYGAGDRRADGGGLEEEGEDIEILEIPFRTALDLVAQGWLNDAKSVVLLQWLALSGRMPAEEGQGR